MARDKDTFLSYRAVLSTNDSIVTVITFPFLLRTLITILNIERQAGARAHTRTPVGLALKLRSAFHFAR